MTSPLQRRAAAALLAFALLGAWAAPGRAEPLTLNLRDTPIQEVYEMLARQGRVNILLAKEVTGKVSVNLYRVALEEAIRAIADANGYVVEERGGNYVVVAREDAGKDALGGNTEVRTFRVQYSDPDVVTELLTKHLSRHGKITRLAGRKLLVAEDLPEFLDRIGRMLDEIDIEPRQILIEAKILEISLDADQIYGIDWAVPFKIGGGDGVVGTQGLAPRGIAGLFLQVVTPDLEAFLNALSNKGRVRTLSTPKLLVLEDQEASVIIGDRLGYRVTTTINQVTTESVEFVESGVILRVNASVDRADRVLLQIHPEVSTGTVSDGIPNVTTTEVTTQLLAEDGQKVFIGGLIRNRATESRTGVPVLGDLPVVGGLFSRREEINVNAETVVLITPHIVRHHPSPETVRAERLIVPTEQALRLRGEHVLRTLEPSAAEPRSEPAHAWTPGDGG